MAGMMRVPRSRGAISGLLLMVRGVWGALIPFIGPYWHYSYTPDTTWDYTTGRLLLEILPGAGAFIGGLLTLGSTNRLTAMLGGWLAALSGAWFVLGMPLSTVWGTPTVGAPTGGTTRQTMEYIGFFGGLGAAIIFLSAFALGRFAVLGVREAERAARHAATQDAYDDQAVAPTETTGTTSTTGRPVDDGVEQAPQHHRLHWPRSRGARHHAGVR